MTNIIPIFLVAMLLLALFNLLLPVFLVLKEYLEEYRKKRKKLKDAFFVRNKEAKGGKKFEA